MTGIVGFLVCFAMQTVMYLIIRRTMSGATASLILVAGETAWSVFTVCLIYLATYITCGKDGTDALNSYLLYIGIQTARLIELIRPLTQKKESYRKAEKKLMQAIDKTKGGSHDGTDNGKD